jgi:hypothetical protein
MRAGASRWRIAALETIETPALISCWSRGPEVAMMGFQAMVHVLLAMVALAACRAPVPPVPGMGGPPWIELTSPHFTLWTDADPDRARELMDKMERLRLILVHAVFPRTPEAARHLAIALRNDAELRAFSRTDQKRAFAVSAQFPLWQPMIVLSASGEHGKIGVSLAHELVHTISSGVIHHQPRWFAEGMASYFQTAGLDSDLDTIEIGGSPTGEPINARLLPISELFEWTTISSDEGSEYITAWALFWFLANQFPTELQHYARLLHQADAEIEQRSDLARQLWDHAFPALPFSNVDRALNHWIVHGQRYEVQRFRLRMGERSINERQLGDADVYAIRAMLRALKEDAQARADAAAALAAEPTHVLARLLAMALDKTEITADEASAIARANKADWRAWMLVAGTVPSGPSGEAEAARARACVIAAANPALSPPPKLCPKHRAAPSSR